MRLLSTEPNKDEKPKREFKNADFSQLTKDDTQNVGTYSPRGSMGLPVYGPVSIVYGIALT